VDLGGLEDMAVGIHDVSPLDHPSWGTSRPIGWSCSSYAVEICHVTTRRGIGCA
jgi:hypothetical protein